jgi:hypothetical protein
MTLIESDESEQRVHGFLHAYHSVQVFEGREVNNSHGWAGTLRGNLPWGNLAGETVKLRLGDGSEAHVLITESHDDWHVIVRGCGAIPFR